MEQLGFVRIPKRTLEIDPQDKESLILSEEVFLQQNDTTPNPDRLPPAVDLIFKLRSLEESPPEATPLQALNVFIAAIELGVYPPIDVLNWLKESFEKFFENEGDNQAPRLDEILKISGRKIFTNAAREHRDGIISKDLYLLEKYFNLSEDRAAGFVSLKYSLLPEHPLFKLGLDVRQIKNIAQEHRKLWQSIFENNPCPDKNEFLASFPKSVRNEILK